MIRYVLFDLDNTLYPASLGLDEEMLERIRLFAARFLNLTPEEALARRKERMTRYGTTLEWLIAEEGLTDVEEYYAAIHPEGEEERLSADPDTAAFIRSLPVPSAVLTNSPMEHAERVIAKLGFQGLFTHIFDIRWNELKGKPAESSFLRALEVLNCRVEEVLFIDDLPSYVDGFIKLGGRGLLLDERDLHRSYPRPRIRQLQELIPYLEA